MPSLPPLLPIVFFLFLRTAFSAHRHIISIPAGVVRPAAVAWDSTVQHFLVASASSPLIFSVSDAGVSETIVSDPLLPPSSFACAIAVDDRRRRLIVALRNPDSLAAYDLRSARPHRCIFSTTLPAAPGSVTLAPATGHAFVTGSGSGVIWKADLEGNVTDLSRSAVYAAAGLDGVAHVRKGFLLVVQGKTGRIFKVDEEDGAAKEVIGSNGNLARDAETVAVMTDGSAVVAGGRVARTVRSGDGWAEAAVKGEVEVEEGKKVRGLALRDGKKAYVLVTPATDEGEEMGSKIVEVEWEEEGDLVWAMVLVGLGLVYFLYWRFQMRQLVSNMNKKRA
ncbi:hypothetical protein AXF42_Ash018275 [Apostasia shenzhenica]|uniref:SMP-30/Gluconolactonase/LRE-like region domain-containing protein n=1 Tax=Apostasia shenzhenica TaxID=1088818 RepID=A0A2I0B2M6_9ASPA|nr:hypothetical protein AXF42_Ash018275 [Apostasia shenzhenica]